MIVFKPTMTLDISINTQNDADMLAALAILAKKQLEDNPYRDDFVKFGSLYDSISINELQYFISNIIKITRNHNGEFPVN